MLIMEQRLHFGGILVLSPGFFLEEFCIIVGKWAAWQMSAPSEFSNINSNYK